MQRSRIMRETLFRILISRESGASATTKCLHQTESVSTQLGPSRQLIEILGSPSRTRTYDLAINSRVLYQLSYRGKSKVRAYSKGRRRLPTPHRRLNPIEIGEGRSSARQAGFAKVFAARDERIAPSHTVSG